MGRLVGLELVQVGRRLKDGDMYFRSWEALKRVPLMQYALTCFKYVEPEQSEARMAGTFTGAGEFTVMGPKAGC